MKWFDSLTNFAAQMGTGKSKMALDQFTSTEISHVELTAMYRSDWMARKIIDVPVSDMLREWRSWNADDNHVTVIEDAEKKWRIRHLIAKAAQMARLYGGSAILIGADVANPMLPLNPNAIRRGGLRYLTALSRHEITASELDRDPRSPTFGQPKLYTVNSVEAGSVQVHPSRVLRFIGSDRLDTMNVADGWGDSILLSIYDAIHHAALTSAGIAELVHEAKVDVIHVPNLGANFASDAATSQLVKRFSTANALKSINNMLLLDDQEKWDRKQTSFAGLPDVLDRYLQIVAGASDIPATRLLGMAPKGMSSTGESDLRNYYDMLAGVRENTIGENLAKLDRILWLDALGSVPTDAYAEWRPLWQMTPKEKADIAKTKAETTQIYVNSGLIDEGILREGVQSQLLEDGTYPALEQAIEHAIGQIRLAGVDPIQEPEAENDNPATDRSERVGRNRIAARAY